MPKETAKTGIAGEFWFFSQLHRLGYEAYITFGNTKGIDIAVQLKHSLITFEVKSKINFSGSYMYLDNVEQKDNHFVVFVDLQSEKEINGKCKLLSNDPRCYIIESKNLKKIAFKWAPEGQKGLGFEARLLPYIKKHEGPNVTIGLKQRFKESHNDEDIDAFDASIIWMIGDFENNYFNEKSAI